jgi:hypothetical protein
MGAVQPVPPKRGALVFSGLCRQNHCALVVPCCWRGYFSFPQHQILRMEVTPPETWPADADKKTIYDPAFTYRKDSRCAGNKIVMEYEYESLADSISPERVGEYIRQINQCSQSLGYTLIWR